MLIIRKDVAAYPRVCEKELQNVFIEKRGNLREVVKSGVNLDCQIQKDTWRRPTYFGGKVIYKERGENFKELSKVESKLDHNVDLRKWQAPLILVPIVFIDSKFGE
jgi:hypothetical protein